MFVRRRRFDAVETERQRLQGKVEGLRLYVEHLEATVEYERNRAHTHNFANVAEVPDRTPTQPENYPLPDKVAAAVRVAARPGTDVHDRLVEAAHNSLQNDMDEERIVDAISRGERAFDSLLHLG